jgi:hypothetical protein
MTDLAVRNRLQILRNAMYFGTVFTSERARGSMLFMIDDLAACLEVRLLQVETVETDDGRRERNKIVLEAYARLVATETEDTPPAPHLVPAE